MKLFHAGRSNFSESEGNVPQKGFALVITLSLMMLLALVALGLLSLASISSRTAANADMATAQANARLALHLAIGELQKYAGPDQRVTANAAILEDPAIFDPTDARAQKNRHWTGVWRTDRFKADLPTGSDQSAPPLIYRDPDLTGPDTGSLRDRRDTTYNKANEVLAWLVSNPDPTNALTPDGQMPADMVTLVGEGSTAESPGHPSHVLAPKVTTPTGAYAWWVSDENTKASFDLPAAQTGAGMVPAWMNPAQSGISAVKGLEKYEDLSDAEVAKSISRHNAELAIKTKLSSDNDFKKSFHALTVGSAGVLADSFAGGLKRDLSAFFVSGTMPAMNQLKPEITQTTPILDAPNLRLHSAKFGILKSWAGLEQKVSASGDVDIVPPRAVANAIKGYMSGPTGNANRSMWDSNAGFDLKNQVESPVHPVIVDAGTFYALSLEDSGKLGVSVDGAPTKRYTPHLHYFPRVVLWNPYQVKLNAANYAVQMAMPVVFKATIIDKKTDGSNRDPLVKVFNTNDFSPNNNSPANLLIRPIFYLPAVSLEPGQALVFTAGAMNSDWGISSSGSSVTVNSQATAIDNFPLSCTVPDPSSGSYPNFRIKMNPDKNFVDLMTQQSARYYISPERSMTGNAYTSSFLGWKQFWTKLWQVKGNAGAGSVTGIQGNDTDNYVPLQYILQSEDGGWGSDVPGDPNVAPSSMDPLGAIDQPVTPFFRSKWGHRIQWLKETVENANTRFGIYNIPFLNHNIFASNNIRANWIFRSPVEVVFRVGGQSGSYGPQGRSLHGMLIDDLWGWEWGNHRPYQLHGKNSTSPFGSAAEFPNLSFPLFSIPTPSAPLLSMGAFQHVSFSPYAWHPTYAFGNAWADPRGKRNRSTNYIAPSNTDATSDPNGWAVAANGHRRAWTESQQGHLDDNMPKQTFLYDLSYEINQALWDRYFISTIPGNYSPGGSIPNSRMRVMDSSASSLPALLNPNTAASKLMVAGAFNVNSTSEDAWAALLATFRETPDLMMPTGPGGTTVSANNIYSRLLHPTGGDSSGTGLSEQATWNGHTTLDDKKIRTLARAIVREVKSRGPFISIADFVNRRLVDPPSNPGTETVRSRMGLKGALQAAIDEAVPSTNPDDPGDAFQVSINDRFLNMQNPYKISKVEYFAGEPAGWGQVKYNASYPKPYYPTPSGVIADAGPKSDHHHFVESKMVGSPAYLSQADILQKLGPVLTARGDTFLIRAYGESKQGATIKARAWIEATVQRTPEPILPDASRVDYDLGNPAYGRKFKIVSFRWMHPEEI